MSLAYENHSRIIVIFISDSAIHSQESPCSTPAPSQAPPPIVRGYENQSQVFSSAGGTENPDGASQTNDDLTVRPDDYTLQHWQKVKPLSGNLFFYGFKVYHY